MDVAATAKREAEGSMIRETSFKKGDRVEKIEGYKYPGIVVAKVRTLQRKVRYVVECTAPDCKGMLHIFNGSQLRKRND